MSKKRDAALTAIIRAADLAYEAHSHLRGDWGDDLAKLSLESAIEELKKALQLIAEDRK